MLRLTLRHNHYTNSTFGTSTACMAAVILIFALSGGYRTNYMYILSSSAFELSAKFVRSSHRLRLFCLFSTGWNNEVGDPSAAAMDVSALVYLKDADHGLSVGNCVQVAVWMTQASWRKQWYTAMKRWQSSPQMPRPYTAKRRWAANQLCQNTPRKL